MLLLGTMLCVACSDDDGGDDGDDTLNVVTSLPLFAEFVDEVGGERVEVTALLPSGADPHTFEPAPRDIAVLADADIVFVNGLDLERAVLNLIEQNLAAGVPLIELAEEAEAAGVEIREGGQHANEDERAGDEVSEGGDPHLWMNIEHAEQYALVIRDQLSLIDPDGAEAFGENFTAYNLDLANLARDVRATTDSIHADDRRLITTHDAFGYMADYLGFEITAFVSAGPGQEASPGDIAAIVEAIEDGGVPAVFTEPQISGESATLEQAAADAGAEICILYSDAFDDEITSYIEMMTFNADELARCLGAP